MARYYILGQPLSYYTCISTALISNLIYQWWLQFLLFHHDPLQGIEWKLCCAKISTTSLIVVSVFTVKGALVII